MTFESGNEVFKLRGMEVEVILASIADDSPPIYTIRFRAPRIIWSEIMTHRVFSRNARSSRAVPFKTMMKELRNGGAFVPWHWTADQRGMQGVGGHNETVWVQKALMPLNGYSYGHTEDWIGAAVELTGLSNDDAWNVAMERACQVSEAFAEAGYHKQLCNRLIEPFTFIDAVITSTDWNNFLHLRDHAAAEPHLMDLADLVKQALWSAEVNTLKPGEWHLPYIIDADKTVAAGMQMHGSSAIDFLKQISAARCARISYAPFDGNATYERELERYNMLVGDGTQPVHASPLEHQATPDTTVMIERCRIDKDGSSILESKRLEYENKHLHGNLSGWIQYRKMIPGEAIYG